MSSPTDLLKNTYIFLQAHTTLRPGPTLKKMLNRAGISEIIPSTHNSTLISTPEPILQNKNSTQMVEIMAGGNRFRENIYLTIFFISMCLVILGAAIYGNDVLTVEWLGAALRTINARYVFVGLASIYGMVELQERIRNNGLLAVPRQGEIFFRPNFPPIAGALIAQLRRRQQAVLAQAPEIINVHELPVLGDFVIRPGAQDIISFDDIHHGQLIAVVHDLSGQLMTVDSLQAWLTSQAERGLNAIHPINRSKIIRREDIKIYRARDPSQRGGKKKRKNNTKRRKTTRKFE